MNNINPKTMQAMLKVVSGKLGMTPQQLQKQLESGKLDEAMKGMSPQDAGRLANALSDPVKAQAILSTPQAQEIINKLKA